MPWVGFEPTIPAFERAKTVHALDSAADLCGRLVAFSTNWNPLKCKDLTVWNVEDSPLSSGKMRSVFVRRAQVGLPWTLRESQS
jgi:hypothetical protein